MPVVVIAPTIVRVSFHKTLSGGHKYANVFDLSVDPAIGSSREDAVTDVMSHVSGWYQDNMVGGPGMLTAQTYTGGSWVDLDSASGGVGSFGPAAGHPTAGTNAGTPATPQVAYLIHLNSTAKRGQRQGRFYLGPVDEAAVDGSGTVTGSVITQLNAIANGFRTAADGYTSIKVDSVAWRTVHVHKPSRTDPSTWTWSSSTIDTVAADPQIATQRRRNR